MNLAKKSSVEEIKERFDNDVERFSHLNTGQKSAMDAPLMMDLITEAAVAINPDAKRMLDIGCGAGNNTLKLLQKINPLDCDLLDLSNAMLKKAEERVSEVNSGVIRVFQGDIRNIELERESYQIVLAAAVLHHLRDESDWRSVFQKIFDITAKGGSVWITDLVFHNNNKIQNMMWKRYGNYLTSVGGEDYKNEVFNYIDKEDSPRSISFQLDLLKDVGFSSVEILHKNSCFAAFGAIK